MISLIEAIRYRCLLDVQQELGAFQVLVGPNASGKSTLLDVIALIGDALKNGVAAALRARSPNLANLLWMEQGDRFELAVELEIPPERAERLAQGAFQQARYELSLGAAAGGELAIRGENLWLKPGGPRRARTQAELFPCPPAPRDQILLAEGTHSPAGWKKVLTKTTESGNDYFKSETTGWNNSFRLGPQRLALANLPEDEERFPVAIWVKRVLVEGVDSLVLSSEAMRKPSPPGSPTAFQPDGSNLPWVVEALRRSQPARFRQWLAHVQTALPEVEDLNTVVRDEDRHRYLCIRYRTGLLAPSWTVSDGTLRLLALTLLAYASPPGRIYLVEEPENGIHPQAVEAVFQSLSSARGCQVLCASHSPVVLALSSPGDLLCFARTAEGATDIVRGSEHPALRDWQRTTDLGTLFASGVMG